MLVNWVLKPIADGWDYEPDVVVWVSVQALETSFRDGDQYVGPGGTHCGQVGRYENIGRHIVSGRATWMPLVSVNRHDQIRFTDGRHRFAWVRDHGAEALPVATGPATAEKLSHLFGTPVRACEVAE